MLSIWMMFGTVIIGLRILKKMDIAMNGYKTEILRGKNMFEKIMLIIIAIELLLIFINNVFGYRIG